jgi:hypothetical protein
MHLGLITVITFGEAYEVMKLLIMQFSPASHHFLHLRSKSLTPLITLLGQAVGFERVIKVAFVQRNLKCPVK